MLLAIMLFFTLGLPSLDLYDFTVQSRASDWVVVDDVVMGGRSEGHFSINEAGHGVFKGRVSLENNGGFSSIRHRCQQKEIDGYSKAVIRLKGDGRQYQFRVKSSAADRHSYITYFQTSGNWQEVEIELKELYPSWRGMKLNMPDFPAENIAEIAFLIANKQAESFRLEIDCITLE